MRIQAPPHYCFHVTTTDEQWTYHTNRNHQLELGTQSVQLSYIHCLILLVSTARTLSFLVSTTHTY